LVDLSNGLAVYSYYRLAIRKMDISETKALIIDMDGVLWRGWTFLPGVTQFFSCLRRYHLPFVLATNNSTVTPEDIVKRLATCDVEIFTQEVLTSSLATATYLQSQLAPGARIHPIGEQAMREVLTTAGFTISEDTENIDAVVVGFDRDITWKKLTRAALAIQRGALFIGTNPDTSFPIEEGQAPGNGAFLAALHVTTQIEPTIVGKPQPRLYLQAASQLNQPNEHILVVGDRIETDILGAQHAGMPSVLLLTGVTSSEQVENSEIQPDWVLDGLPELVVALQGT
jgi:4-nitrophenyl phosphatase